MDTVLGNQKYEKPKNIYVFFIQQNTIHDTQYKL